LKGGVSAFDLWLAVGWLACLGGFVALAVYAGSRAGPGPDVGIERAVQDLPSFIGSLLDVVNWLGGGWPSGTITALFALAFLLRGRWPEAVLFGLTGVPRFVQSLIKEIVEAPRPAPDQVHVHQIVTSYAFPSGHVVGTTLVFGLAFGLAALLPLGRRGVIALRCVCVAMIVAIGPARVWAGVHWPTDVAGGYLFAALWLIPTLRLHAARVRRSAELAEAGRGAS
jgi:undecaprenyl-diphosphatase